MSSLQLGHPEQEQLLRYADGELAASDAARVRAHLEACWQCRKELAEIHEIVGECVEYRTTVREYLPPTPAPWVDLHRLMAESDTATAGETRRSRLAGALRWPFYPRRWVPAVAAAAVMVGIYFQFRHVQPVEAAELLRKAVTAAEQRPQAARRIQIRTSKQRLTRVVGVRDRRATKAEEAPAVEALFVAAHYSWEDPLSAQAYASWREQLADRRDEVTLLHKSASSDPEGYQIRTTSASSILQEATLRLNAADLRPVEERLQFRNQEWVEIRELPAPPEPVAEAPTELPSPPAVIRRIPEAPAPPSPATAGEELRVLAALHQLGADLGEPIEVKRNGGQILVRGVGVAADRQKQIQAALGPLPKVEMEFSEPARPKTPDEQQAPVEVAAGPEAGRLQSRVEQQLGGHQFFAQLATQVLDMSDTIMSRAYALRRLAERFPEPAEAQLSAAEQAVLRGLRQEHAAVLTQQSGELERLLAPVLVPLAAPVAGGPRHSLDATAWQAATEELFQAARNVETRVAAIFAGAQAAGPDGQLPGELLRSLAQLRASAQAYERLTAQPPEGKVK